MNRSFESVENAENRRTNEIEKIAVGEMKAKDHTGCFDKMSWDKEGLINEVSSYNEDTIINWSQLANRFGINDSKGMLEYTRVSWYPFMIYMHFHTPRRQHFSQNLFITFF